eukprot:m.4470 g.4470  ORF g.4470 m.4470 type:complete len:1187 (+) comp1906_c0_seq1:36-3596(+)
MGVLPWILERRLLDPALIKHDANVLDGFPIPAAVQLISLVVDQLRPLSKSILTTPAHVEWAMTSLSKGCALALSEETLIEGCLAIYDNWLQSRPNTPQAVLDSPDVFLPAAAAHISQIFAPQAGMLARQLPLCRRALTVFQTAARVQRTATMAETLLRLLVGVADSLLSRREGECELADELCDGLLATMLDVWLAVTAERFPGRALWEVLAGHCQRWRHRKALFALWHRVLSECARLILAAVDPPAVSPLTPAPSLMLMTVSPTNDDMMAASLAVMRREVLLLTWHHLLALPGDPAHGIFAGMPEDCALEAMLALSDVADIFLGSTRRLGASSILRIAGPWLFGLCTSASHGQFVAARAVALGVISRVICAPQPDGHTFSADILHHFYRLVFAGVAEPAIASAVILNARHLFTQPLPGCFVVVFPFLKAIERALTTADQSEAGVLLRLASLRQLLALTSMPTVLPALLAPRDFDRRDDVVSATDVRDMVAAMCLAAVAVETSPQNMALLLKVLLLLIFDDETPTPGPLPPISESPERAHVAANEHSPHGGPSNEHSPTARNTPARGSQLLVVRLVEALAHSLYNEQYGVVHSALEALLGCVPTLGLWVSHHPSLPFDVIGALCDLVTKLVTLPPVRHTKALHTLIVAAYVCVYNWLAAIPSVRGHEVTMQTVANIALLGLTGIATPEARVPGASRWTICKAGPRPFVPPGSSAPDTSSPSYRVQEAAALLLAQIASPGRQTKIPDSILAHEYKLLSAGPLTTASPISLFCVDGHTLLSIFLDGESETTAPSFTAVVRDQYGRFAWRIQPATCTILPTTSTQGFTSVPPSPFINTNEPAATLSHRLDALGPVPEVFGTIAQLPRGPEHQRLAAAIAPVIEQERAIAERELGRISQIEAMTPPPATRTWTALTVARMLLATLGLCEPGAFVAQGDFPPMLSGLFSNDQSLFSAIRVLDSQPLFDTVSAPVICIGQDGSALTYDNVADEASDRFWQFYHSLRVEASTVLSPHVCRQAHDQTLPPVRVIENVGTDFHYWTETFTPDPPLTIVFLEAPLDYAAFLAGPSAGMLQGRHVVVSPHGRAAYIVATNFETDMAGCGPLAHGAVINARIAAHAMRLTAANLWLRGSWVREGYSMPHIVRRKQIEKIATVFSAVPVGATVNEAIAGCIGRMLPPQLDQSAQPRLSEV